MEIEINSQVNLTFQKVFPDLFLSHQLDSNNIEKNDLYDRYIAEVTMPSSYRITNQPGYYYRIYKNSSMYS